MIVYVCTIDCKTKFKSILNEKRTFNSIGIHAIRHDRIL